MIGIDSEWRPTLSKFSKTRPAIIQLSDGLKVFIIDMISLAESKILD